jgi:hypothetical protein
MVNPCHGLERFTRDKSNRQLANRFLKRYSFRMKKLTALLFFAVLCTGCRANMMETHGDTIQLFKTGQEKPGRGGVVRYLNTGMDSWRKARRTDAEKQMQQFCKGPYTITAEGPRSKFGAAMPIGNHSSLEVDQYTYVAFECHP